MEFKHKSVLLDECIQQLNIKADGIYVDGTVGGGGHSQSICERLGSNGRLIAIDQDSDALTAARMRLNNFSDNVTFIHSSFFDIENVLHNIGVFKIDGCLLDLGVSSYQLDETERGFSYMRDAKLDMRMNTENSKTAYDVVNTYTSQELIRILFEYGEERWSRRIVQFIIDARKSKPIETTFELVSVIKAAVPKAVRFEGRHPAKKTFQAIRIEVNNELGILEKTIKDTVRLLNTGGRMAVITFHSLEDRIVKHTFSALENPCTCPREFPVCICGNKQVAKVVNRKPILPSENELRANHRSRSAKLRVIERMMDV